MSSVLSPARFVLFSLLFFCQAYTHAEDLAAPKTPQETAQDTPPPIGNFALRTSQQPGPLVGFGENILDKGETQLFLMADEYKKKKGYMTDAVPGVLYGITDYFSVFANLPDVPRNKEFKNRSAGLGDAFVQLECAYFTDKTKSSIDQATVVANVTFPTGSFNKKDPHTGFGSPSFFIGTTYNRTMIDWFYFGALGAVLTTHEGNNKAGDQYLYQAGFGRNIPSPDGWIFAWMIEGDGLYASKDIVKGSTDPNSGGNALFITPSLWFSSNRIIVQLGAGAVLTQHLYGKQSRFTHQFVCNLGWAF